MILSILVEFQQFPMSSFGVRAVLFWKILKNAENKRHGVVPGSGGATVLKLLRWRKLFVYVLLKFRKIPRNTIAILRGESWRPFSSTLCDYCKKLKSKWNYCEEETKTREHIFSTYFCVIPQAFGSIFPLFFDENSIVNCCKFSHLHTFIFSCWPAHLDMTHTFR